MRPGGMDPGQDERRRDDRTLAVQTTTDALGEGGLAGPEVAAGDHQVAGSQQAGEPDTEILHLLGGGDIDGHRQRPGQDDPVASGSSDGEAAVLPERDQLGDLLPGEQLGGEEAELGRVVQGRIDHRGGDPVSLERPDGPTTRCELTSPGRSGSGCSRIEPAGATVHGRVDPANGGQLGPDRLRGLVDRRRRRIERRSCSERGMDHVDHPRRIGRGGHRHHQVGHGDVHRRKASRPRRGTASASALRTSAITRGRAAYGRPR